MGSIKAPDSGLVVDHAGPLLHLLRELPQIPEGAGLFGLQEPLLSGPDIELRGLKGSYKASYGIMRHNMELQPIGDHLGFGMSGRSEHQDFNLESSGVVCLSALVLGFRSDSPADCRACKLGRMPGSSPSGVVRFRRLGFC